MTERSLIYNSFLKRTKLISLSFLFNLFPPLFTLILSLIVVRLISFELWGEYIKVFLFILFLVHFLSWGNKDFLLKEFSLEPSKIDDLWRKSIASRTIFILPVLIVLFFTSFSLSIKAYVLAIVILRYIYQSYDCFIHYERDYSRRISLESLTGLFILSGVYFFRQRIMLEDLLLIFLLMDFVKTFSIMILTKKYFYFRFENISIEYIKSSFPFFLLIFTSLAISKADQIVAAFMLNTKDVGKYQIIMSFLLLMQACSNYFLHPFLKNIYRLSFKTIKSISWKLTIFGGGFIFAGILILQYILIFFYKVETSLLFALISFLFVLPVFSYTMFVFYFIKTNRLNYVTAINVIGSIVTFISAYLLFQWSGYSIMNLLLAAAFGQFFQMMSYHIILPRYFNLK
jgi:O-antigen/teichoic acid export membrane protein